VTIEATERLDLGCQSDEPPCAPGPVGAWTEVAVMGYFADAGRVVPKRIEPPGFVVAVNDLRVAMEGHEYDYDHLFDEGGREILTGLVAIDSVNGTPVWDNNTVILKKPGRSLTLPVTREAYLRALLKRHASERIIVDVLQPELAALSAEERRTPAYVGTAESLSRLVASNAEGATALVTLNPAYFDSALPRTAVQLIAIHFSYGNRYRDEAPSAPDYAPDAIRVWELRKAIDYARLQRFVR
jgi:hypothetical protein